MRVATIALVTCPVELKPEKRHFMSRRSKGNKPSKVMVVPPCTGPLLGATLNKRGALKYVYTRSLSLLLKSTPFVLTETLTEYVPFVTLVIIEGCAGAMQLIEFVMLSNVPTTALTPNLHQAVRSSFVEALPLCRKNVTLSPPQLLPTEGVNLSKIDSRVNMKVGVVGEDDDATITFPTATEISNASFK
jgi:hypothetical protein